MEVFEVLRERQNATPNPEEGQTCLDDVFGNDHQVPSIACMNYIYIPYKSKDPVKPCLCLNDYSFNDHLQSNEVFDL